MAYNQSPDLSRKPIHEEYNTSVDVSERNHFEYYSSTRERILEDGNNWRKYAVYNNGENRRLYFKCTHPNCKLKKKVDNSHDGQITDIIYVGDHNHAEPQLGEDPEAKRRKKLNSTSSLSSRSVGEPKIVIQIKTDEDILDDGYCWNKYAQNVIKGNRNLRRYYKCTSDGLGCKIKKRVERDSGNLIIQYEGRHNHEVPECDSASIPTANNLQQYSQQTDVEEDEAVFLGGGYNWREYGESYYKCSHPNRSCGLELSDPLSSAHGLGLGSSAFSLGEVPQVSGGNGIFVKIEGGSAWKSNMTSNSVILDRNKMDGTNDFAGTPNELFDPLSSVHGKSIELRETTSEVSTIVSNHGNAYDEEPEAKIRKNGNVSNDLRYEASSFYQMNFHSQNPIPYASYYGNGSSSVGSFMPDFPASFPFSFPNVDFEYNSEKFVVAPVNENDTRLVQPFFYLIWSIFTNAKVNRHLLLKPPLFPLSLPSLLKISSLGCRLSSVSLGIQTHPFSSSDVKIINRRLTRSPGLGNFLASLHYQISDPGASFRN